MIEASELSKYTTVEKGGITHMTESYGGYHPYEMSCGTIACAILLRYYYTQESNKYISASYNTEKKLYDMLFPMIDEVPGTGTQPYDLKVGLQKYLSNRDINKTVTATYTKQSSLANIYNRIKSHTKTKDRPLLVALEGSSYGNHWVVATGYWTVKITGNGSSTTAKYIRMNDGQLHTGVYINLKFTEAITYIN